MGYRYDLHCHTAEGSKCSIFPVRDMVAFYKEKGYSGFVITDHFSGNSAFDPAISWKDRIERLYGIYDAALDEAAKLGGVTPFLGLEYALRTDLKDMRASTGNHYLIYGLSKEFLLENEAAFCLDYNHCFDLLHEAGAYIIHAHPFHEADFIKSIILTPRKEDAVEIVNGGCTDFENEFALPYADRYGLAVCSGSDIHRPTHAHLRGIETETPCTDIHDIINAIKERKVKIVRIDNQ